MQHKQNVGPLLFVRNENIAHVMPHVAVCAVTSCMHRMSCARWHTSHPNYTWCVRKDVLIMQAELHISKLTASH